MTVFKRTILIVVSLILVLTSLHVMNKDIYFHMNQKQIILNVVIGSIIAIYNFLIIYKRATTVYYVMESDGLQERRKKGESHND